MKKNILVTGCGSDIGQSIGSVIKKWQHLGKLIGTDIESENAAKFIYDEFLMVPRFNRSEYDETIKNIIKEYSIDAIIIGTEGELRMITEKEVDDNYFGIPLVAVNLETRVISFDKFKTAKFLKEEKLPYPYFHLAKEYNKVKKFPIIFKSKFGASSNNVEIINTEEQLLLNPHFANPEYFIQEYLPGDDKEFTCCVYRDNKGNMNDIIFRRKLVDGFSIYGELISDATISKFIREVAQIMNVSGSINLQLRMVNKRPMLFEINPRFSSTVEFRHEFGFKDLIWSLEDKFNLTKIEIRSNEYKFTKFYRSYKGFYE